MRKCSVWVQESAGYSNVEVNPLSFMLQLSRPDPMDRRCFISYKYLDMNRETTPYCATFGFDSTRIREVLSILGLSAEHGLLAERMRAEVIAGKADELVDSCLAPLARSRGFTLIERNIGIESFKRTWIERLQYYGQDFDTAEYFGDRLASAAAYARAKIPLGIFSGTALPYPAGAHRSSIG